MSLAELLPKGWAVATASEVCEKIQDGTHFSPKTQLPEGRYRYLTAKNVRPSGLDLADVAYLREEDHRAIYARCDPHRGDVLLVKDGVNAGDAALNTLQEEFSLLSSVCFLRPHPLLRGGFLRYYLLSPVGAGFLTDNLTGTAIRRIVLERVRELPVVIAPLDAQRRIVEDVDSYLSRLGEAEAALERVQRNLKRYRAAVLQAAVSGRLVPTQAELARAEGRDYEPASDLLKRILAERRRRWEEAGLMRLKAAGRAPQDDKCKARYEEPTAGDVAGLPDLPAGWCWATVDQLGDVSGGLTKNPKRDSLAMRLPYLRVANVYANELRLDEIEDIGVTASETQRTLLRRGDLLVVEGNGSLDQLGRVAVWNGSVDPCLHQNHVIKIRFEPATLSGWVLWWLLSPPGREHIQRVASSTSGLHTLSLSKVGNLPVPWPPREEQKRIAAEVDRRLSIALAASERCGLVERRSERLRQSILKWAFEGKLVDQDSNDEPASVLLERIRAERAAQTAAKPAGRPRGRGPRRR